EEVVDVGAQVAGKIEVFGEDAARGGPIDYGSEVEEGTVLAHIDDSLYKADVRSHQAQADQSKASVTRNAAGPESRIAAQAQAEAGVALARIAYQHLRSVPEEAQSDIEIETAEATLKQAEANLGTAKANVSVGRAMQLESEKAVVEA